MHETFEFDQLMQGVGDEEEDKEIKVEADDEEETALNSARPRFRGAGYRVSVKRGWP